MKGGCWEVNVPKQQPGTRIACARATTMSERGEAECRRSKFGRGRCFHVMIALSCSALAAKQNACLQHSFLDPCSRHRKERTPAVGKIHGSFR